jgi:hypothetical protein
MSMEQNIEEVILEHIRLSTITRSRLPARVAFKDTTSLYGIYWGGDVEGWIPCRWCYPSGNYRLDGRQSDLDLSLPDWRELKDGNTNDNINNRTNNT